MHVWLNKSEPTQYIIHNLNTVLVATPNINVEEFEQQQANARIKYQAITEELEGSELGKYGVTYKQYFISDSWGQLTVTELGDSETQLRDTEHLYKIVDRVNQQYGQVKLSQVFIEESLDVIQRYVPEEYHQQTYYQLTDLQYKNDLQLVVDSLSILNSWLASDGIEGRCVYTEDGLEIHFDLEHPIIVHLGGYGRHKQGVDRTFLVVLQPYSSIDCKMMDLINIYIDFYSWLNPQDLTYQTNKTLGDERILVTLKDNRILEYQEHIKQEFKKVEQHDLVSTLQLTFSHTTRSVYADIYLKKGLGMLRVSVRDHQKSYEEGTIKIIVNTLKAKNIAERVIKEIENYVEGGE